MSQDRIKELLGYNKQYRKTIRALREQVDRNDDEIVKIIATLYNEGKGPEEQVDPSNLTMPRAWECGIDWQGNPKPKSPTGYCIYDEVNDPCCDTCIYCHQPLERK